MSYSWLSWGSAQQELATRLQDNFVFWPAAEVQQYLAFAMREFNALTAFNLVDYPVTLTPPFTTNWFQANGAGSPRIQTQTDTSIYTLIEMMLLEPPTGGTWTGTNQFSIAALAQALQGRRDESLQQGATNVAEITLPITPNTSVVTLPDNTLDVVRVRYVPAAGQGSPATLFRGDQNSFRVYSANYLTTTQTAPTRWDIISGPPLNLILDYAVPVPATLQVLTLQAGPTPAPPTATPLGIPDDWTWGLVFGVLYDLLSSQEEAKDLERAGYCLQRYGEYLRLLRDAPWLVPGRTNINNIACATPSVISADRYAYEWQAKANAFPQIVVAGTDLYALSPVPTDPTAVLLVVVGNMPIPTASNQDVQVPRDVMDAILDEAEHLAQFKRGGSEWQSSLALHESFMATCERWRRRIAVSGIFTSEIRSPVVRGEDLQPRFATKE